MDNSISSLNGLNRALALLDVLSLYPHGISLAEISRETQLPKSTIHRLLNELADAGFAVREPKGIYRLSFKICELSSRILGGLDILQVASPIVKSLSDRTHETVHLSVPAQHEIVYLRKEIPSDSPFQSKSYVGLRSPMYCTAAGKSMLSAMDNARVRQLWEQSSVVSITENTITRLSVLMEELDTARQRHYALDNEENEPGINCIASCIRGHDGQPVGAVSISAASAIMTPDRIGTLAPEIIQAAESISYCMGYQYKS